MMYQESTSASTRLQDMIKFQPLFHTTQFLLHPAWFKHFYLMTTSIYSLFSYSEFLYYSSSFQLLDIPTPTITCSDIDIIVEEVFHALISLDPSKSAGYDQISPKLSKHCAPAVLHHLFHLRLDQTYIPSNWRMHLITPILINRK